MNAAELLEKRKPEWQELEALLDETKRVTANKLLTDPDKAARFTMLYRSVCSDLALAESYQFPTGTIRYLNGIIGRAHHYLYYTSRSGWKNIRRLVFVDVPRWILTDFTFWLAFVLFWGGFVICFAMSHIDTSFPEHVLGSNTLISVERMHMHSQDEMDFEQRMMMAGYYIMNNGGIGLKCFAFGVIGGICGAFILLRNSIFLGVLYGFMSGPLADPQSSENFMTFITAHSVFELTAIIMSAAAGMKIGIAFFAPHGYRRMDSMRLAGRKATPIIMTAFILFFLAALIEAFISPSPHLPLWYKRGIAIFSGSLLFVYIVIFGGIAQLRASRGMPEITSEREL